MNIENVKALTDLLSNSSLTAIEVGEGKNRIRVERGHTSALPAVNIQAASIPIEAPQSTASEATLAPQADDSVDFNNLTEIRSPLVGVYYSSSSPESEPFVSIGSKIKKGDILCIIETMKLMNEVVSEHDGEIVDICIKSGDIAEFGQPLFKIKAG